VVFSGYSSSDSKDINEKLLKVALNTIAPHTHKRTPCEEIELNFIE